ncbi:MAG TPA: AraC family transcriptional regulator [Bacteroidales bacterium]|nr:AraC family transcriptional regulator [Bacteroidales bacterium]
MALHTYYKTSDRNICIVCGRGISRRVPLHRHVSLSVGMILEGQRILTIRNNKYMLGKGDIFIINAEEPHSIGAATQQEHDYIVVSFSQSYIKDYASGFRFPAIIDSQLIREELTHLFSLLIGNTAPENLQLLLAQIIKELAGFKYSQNYDPEDDRIQRVKYLLDKFPETGISLDELAEKAFMSMFHFSRLFKRYTGLAPHRYLLDNRIRHARKLLENNIPVGDVAILSGFYDSSHFVRHFQTFYGISPLEFQKRSQTVHL